MSRKGPTPETADRNLSKGKNLTRQLSNTAPAAMGAPAESPPGCSNASWDLGETEESAAKYRGLLEAAPDAMVVVKEGGEIIFLNAQVKKQFGYRRGELVRRNIKKIIPEGFAERLIADALRSAPDALAQQMGMGIELIGRRKDGSEFPIEIMLSPLESAEGILVTAAIRNISMRKDAERHLAHMERRYRGLLEAAPDAMVVTEESGTIVLLNVQAEKRFGYRRDELIGQSVKNIIPQGFAERLIADALRSAPDALAQQMGTGIELIGRRKDGSEFPIEIMLSPLESAEGTLVTAAIRDISVRKAAELGQRQIDEAYRVLFDGNPHPMWVFDLETKAILAVNDAAVRIYGYSREEFLQMTGRDLWPLEEVGPYEIMFAAHGNQAMPLGAGGLFKHRKKSGEVIEVEIARSPIMFHGRSAMLSLANDVTVRNSLQAQLLRPQKMESLGRLAGGLAHDLNNLMGVVLGYGELALGHLDRANPVRQNIEGMQKAAGQAVSIVRQLLAFSRKQIQQPQKLSLNRIIENVQELLHRLISNDIQLSINLASDLWTVKADPGQLEQVIMNLVLNARDAMPKGGRLTISTANIELNETDTWREFDLPTGPHVMLTISDNGCGMDEKTQGRIFEPFFTTKDPGKGTGLGLSTAYGIVKQSGGSISVHSAPGQGSTFRIWLPRVEGAPEPHSVATAPIEIPRGSETVLLVEDAEPVREVVRQFLQEGGYNVLAAMDGTAALAASRNHDGPIQLLLTDVVMPGLSGPQIAQELRTTRPGMRVLFMSGYTDEALGVHGVLEQGVALLEKPFTRGSLLRKLREVLDPINSSQSGETT